MPANPPTAINATAISNMRHSRFHFCQNNPAGGSDRLKTAP
jgi:hypothetical protein